MINENPLPFEYNTDRTQLVLKGYGRNVQKLVEYVTSFEHEEDQKKAADVLLRLLKQLDPTMRDTSENMQRIWDHLYLMSGRRLQIESEDFTPPEEHLRDREPQQMDYKTPELKYRHYGRNIHMLIQKASVLEDPIEQLSAVARIGKLMKSLYNSWSNENIEDKVILQHISDISDGEIQIDYETVKEAGLFDSQVPSKGNSKSHHQDNSGGGHHSGKRSRRRGGGGRVSRKKM